MFSWCHNLYNLMHFVVSCFCCSFVKFCLLCLLQCLDCSGSLLTDEILKEAEESCCFLARLAKHRCEWRLQLPEVLQKLMVI